MNGIKPVWASEIEKFPIAVTKARFPNMLHLGDITQINGADIEPVDIIVGGSPCQDLSVAGRQKGLMDGGRSHLFFEMTRVIKEMRTATNNRYPRYVLWENVPNALRITDGKDFYEVIKQFADIAESGVSIPEPEKGKNGKLAWRNAGEIVGNGWSIAWRVLDSQYFGVAQRRRRVFLVLDLVDECAGQILFESEGVCWTPEKSREIWRTASCGIGDCAEIRCFYEGGHFGTWLDGKPTLRHSGGNCGGGSECIVIEKRVL